MSYVYQNLSIGQRLDVNSNGQIVATTKGDLIGSTGTQSVRVPVGTDGQALTASSATSSGLAWQTITPASIGLGAGDGLVLTGNTLNVGGSTTVVANPDSIAVNSSAIANQVLLSTGTVGTAATYGAVPLGSNAAVTGTLGIGNGGTGANSFTSSRLVASNANGTSLVATSVDPATVVTTTSTSTLTNKTLSIPIVTSSINDASSNELIVLSPTASAVNEITISNAAAGTSPSITASGNDTNVGFNINAKGTGKVSICGLAYPNIDGSSGQVLATNGAGALSFVNVPVLTTGSVSTTDATVTTIASLTIPTIANTAYMVEAKILAKQPSSANIASFVIKATFVNNAGTLTRSGLDLVYTPVSTTWTANVSSTGTNIIVTVAGASATNVGWVAQTSTLSLTN